MHDLSIIEHGRTPAAVACQFLVERVQAAAGDRWLQGRRRPPLACQSTEPSVRLFAEARLYGMPELAARALVYWANGERPLELWRRAPSPVEMLALQARGRRCLSLLDELERKEGLAFAIHDLCHLEKFVAAPFYEPQVGFFALLEQALADRRWAALEAGLDAAWERDRDHVLADMNGSALFLFCGLRARLQRAYGRASGSSWDDRFELLLELFALPPSVREAARRVSSRQAEEAACECLDGYFREWGARCCAV